jgi:hypothetical protein
MANPDAFERCREAVELVKQTVGCLAIGGERG